MNKPRVIIGLREISNKFFSSSFLVINAAALVKSLINIKGFAMVYFKSSFDHLRKLA